jgi:SAM-dependent methyltransferase
MTPWKYKDVEPAGDYAEMNARSPDLAQPCAHIDCPVCGFFDSRVVCSATELAAQHQYLSNFYRRRWRVQNEASAEDRVNFTQDYSTHIVECLGCGLVYRNPRPSPDAIVQAFRRDRYTDAYLRAEYRSQRIWARHKFASVARRLMRTRRNKAPRVLEIGSFVGGFLAEGLAHGWDMFGVDPGHDVTAFCRARGLPVFCGTIEEATLNPGSFDAVVIWNTFDQLPDPHPTLAAATRLLCNGGMLVIRVPNGACFQWAMQTLPRLPVALRRPLKVTLAWNNLLTFPYLYGYAIDPLTGLVHSHGFRRVDCVPDSLMPPPARYLKLGAILEERCCEWLCRALRQAPGLGGHYSLAPWLDVYFERACGDRQEKQPATGSNIRLGLLPVYAPTALGQTRFIQIFQ